MLVHLELGFNYSKGHQTFPKERESKYFRLVAIWSLLELLISAIVMRMQPLTLPVVGQITAPKHIRS